VLVAKGMRCRQEVEIVNTLGLHARAAAKLAQEAKTFHSSVSIKKNGNTANAKSILDLLTLAATKGSRVEILAEGEDAELAINALKGLIDRKFDEEA
jgi:phosphotransferase system HPr (HPr) family protein